MKLARKGGSSKSLRDGPSFYFSLGIKQVLHGLRNDFQRGNLFSFEFEKESKVNGAAGKIPNQMAGDDRPSVLLFTREGLGGVIILCRGIRLPCFDGSPASMGVALVFHNGILSEAS